MHAADPLSAKCCWITCLIALFVSRHRFNAIIIITMVMCHTSVKKLHTDPMNEDPDAPIFGVGRKSVRKTQSNSPGSSPSGPSASKSAVVRESASPETSSPPAAPRKTLVGRIASRLSVRSASPSKKKDEGPVLAFDDTGDVDKVRAFLDAGGDVNHVFTTAHPWAFLYGERPTILIAACFWKRSNQSDVVQLCLDRGCDTKVETTMGFTAYEIANDQHPEWSKELRESMNPTARS
jgi:hypothetical protein